MLGLLKNNKKKKNVKWLFFTLHDAHINCAALLWRCYTLINPRRACAERVTVLVSCVCVCLGGVKNQNLEISVRKEKVKRVRGVCRRQ